MMKHEPHHQQTSFQDQGQSKDTEISSDNELKPDLSSIRELRKHLGDQEEKINSLGADKVEEKSMFSPNLQKIFSSQQRLREAKSKKIEFTKPIISRGDDPIIFPNTINVIQGKAGVHKSRLAEILCSSILLRLLADSDKLLGFTKSQFKEYQVLYVDTERNLKEQLPYALQSIQLKAGYGIDEEPENFDFISLLDIERTARFTSLKEYLDSVRQSHADKHIFIVLDVTTDCIKDFNRTDDSMELIDMMNMYINEYDVTFLALIHENPGGEKARGHLGTEIMNKSSTVIQVGFEKDANQQDTDLIRVKYLKCRSTRRLDAFHIKYSQEEKGLVLADASDVSELINKRKHKAGPEDLVQFLEAYLGDGQPMKNADLLDKLCKDFKSSSKTISERLKTLIAEETEVFNEHGQPCQLMKTKAGKEVMYSLTAKNPY